MTTLALAALAACLSAFTVKLEPEMPDSAPLLEDVQP